MQLHEAIAATQAAEAALNAYDAALAIKTDSDKAKLSAVTAFNASIDELIAAATAAKVPLSAPQKSNGR